MLFYSYFKTLVGKEVGHMGSSASAEAAQDAMGLRSRPTGGQAAGHQLQAATTSALAGGPVHPPCPVLCVLQVTVELKNDLAITGTLHSVDQYLNIKLTNTHVQNETKYPHMVRAAVQELGAGGGCSKSSQGLPAVEGMNGKASSSRCPHMSVPTSGLFCWPGALLQPPRFCAAVVGCRCLCATALCVAQSCAMCW